MNDADIRHRRLRQYAGDFPSSKDSLQRIKIIEFHYARGDCRINRRPDISPPWSRDPILQRNEAFVDRAVIAVIKNQN